MIAQNELRIGNWFYDGCTDKSGKLIPATVRALDEDIDPYVFLEPIPLTPEILEKCGFEFSETRPRQPHWFIKVKGQGRFIVYESSINRMRDIFKIYFTGHWGGIKTEIKSLHQLQNLYYALTQTELKIQL